MRVTLAGGWLSITNHLISELDIAHLIYHCARRVTFNMDASRQHSRYATGNARVADPYKTVLFFYGND